MDDELNPMEVGTVTEEITIPDVPADDVTPTPEEARGMFDARPDLAAVLTTDGWLRRDGTLA